MPNPLAQIVQQLDSGQTPQMPTTADNDLDKKQIVDVAKEESDICFDYQKAKTYLFALADQWDKGERVKTEGNRLTRDIEVHIDSLREEGLVDDDECFIPSRVIDLNIERGMPPYINYLKNSRRVAIFKDVIDMTFDTDLLEQEFTRVMTYKGWVIPYYKEIDSSATHGWAAVEVLYDESKPGHVGVEYIAHENLIFPHDAEDIQSCSSILRRYMLTPMDLKSWSKPSEEGGFGFDFAQVRLLINKNSQQPAAIDRSIEIYKRFCKYNGVVYVAWFSKDGACTDWLKKPVKHYVGIDELQDTLMPPSAPNVTPISPDPQTNGLQMPPQMTKTWVASDVKNYPVFILPYRQTEKPYIFDFKGRVFLDQDKQEFATSLQTAFCNGLNRSINVYASPDEDTINDGKPAKMLANMVMQNGGFYDKPMRFYNQPCPNPLVLKAIESFADANSEETGQTNYATQNREDSRKTATEIKASEQTSDLLDSVDLTLLSEHMRDILSFSWLIVRSQALQNRIKFLQINPQDSLEAGQQGGIPQQPQQQQGALPMGMQPQLPPPIQSIVDSAGSYQQESTVLVNDFDTIIRQFDVRAGGDVDVVQKQELVQQMQTDWPVIQTTPLATVFLIDLMKLKYPMNADRYAKILMAGDPKNSIIQALGTAIQGIVKMPEVAQHIGPAEIKQLQDLEMQSKQVLQQP